MILVTRYLPVIRKHPLAFSLLGTLLVGTVATYGIFEEWWMTVWSAVGLTPEKKDWEDRVRRMAQRQGLSLRKTRRRNEQAPDYGKYYLVDLDSDMVVFGYNGDVIDADLDDIEERLALTADSQTLRFRPDA